MINEIIDVILDSSSTEPVTTQTLPKITNDELILENVFTLRKKLFIKEKLPNRATYQPHIDSKLLEAFEQKETEIDFLIAPPSENDRDSVRIRVYLFGTYNFIDIHVSS